MKGKIFVLFAATVACFVCGHYISGFAATNDFRSIGEKVGASGADIADYNTFISHLKNKNVYEKSEETPFTYLDAEEFQTLSVNTVAVSADGKTARLCLVEGYKFYSLEITLEDGTTKSYELTNMFFTALLNFEWIDEERVILEGHINPELNLYIIYDLTTNTFTSYNGLYFVWDDAYENMYYVEKKPYWTDEQVSERILDMDGKIYFETEPGQTLVHNLILNDNSTVMGFFVQNGNTDFEMIDMDTSEILYEDQNVSYKNAEINIR